MKQTITALTLSFALVLSLLVLVPQPVRAQSNILTLTCTGNATTDTAALNAAKTNVGSVNPVTFQLPFKPVTQRCKWNTTTISANITLDNTNGSGIFVVTGQTLSLSPNIVNPERRQMFFNATAGLGTVTFTSGAPVLSPFWWGAKGDGTTDDTAAFQATFAAPNTNISGEDPASYKKGAIVNIPVQSVYYSLSSTINIYRPLDIRGAGSNSGQSTQPSVDMRWNTATTGIIVHRYNTFPSATGTQADGTVISGLNLRGTISASTGTANLSGLTVTRVTGPNFNEDFNSHYVITINGWEYVVETLNNANSLTVYKPRLRVRVTNGSATVTLPVEWTPNMPSGDWNGVLLKIDGVTYTISSHTASVITLTVPYAGATANSLDAQVQSVTAITGVPTTLNKFHGIQSFSQFSMHDMLIQNFSGNGVNLDTSTIPSCCPLADNTNANNSKLDRVMSLNNRGHGILTRGENSNNIILTGFNGQDNRGAGVMETSFLGNTWTAPHLASNRFAAFFSNADTCYYTITGMYTEDGQPSNVGSQYGKSDGGDQGAGWTRPNMGYFYPGARIQGDYSGYLRQTPTRVFRQSGDSDGVNPAVSTGFYLGEAQAAYPTIFGFGAGNDTASLGGGVYSAALPGPGYRLTYCGAGTALPGHFSFGYGDPTCADATKQVLSLSTSTASEGSAKIAVPSGLYFGATPDTKLVRTGTSALALQDGSSGFSSFAAGSITATGNVVVGPNGASAGELRLPELAVNGTNYLGFKSPASVTANKVWELPNGDGTNGQILQTNGAGVLSWSVNSATGMANPMTTLGDSIYGGVAGVATRAAIGTPGQVWTVGGAGIPEWGAGGGAGGVCGSTTQVQFNLAGVCGADAGFIWDNTAKALKLSTATVGTYNALFLRNTNNGTGSSLGIRMGNDIRDDAFVLKINSSTFTSEPSTATIHNRENAALAFGTNGLTRGRFTAGGEFDLLGAFGVLGHSAMGATATIDQAVVVPATEVLNVRETLTTFPGGDGKWNGINTYITIDPNNDQPAGHEIYVHRAIGSIASGSVRQYPGTLYGATGEAFFGGTQTLASARGLYGEYQHFGSGTVTASYAGLFLWRSTTGSSAGLATAAYGVFGNINNNQSGMHVVTGTALTGLINNAGVMDQGYTIRAVVPTNFGTLTNLTGVRIDDHSGIGATTSRNLDSLGINSINYLQGKVGIGTSTPGSKLEVKAGINSSDATVDGLAVSTTQTGFTTKGRFGSNYDASFLSHNAYYNGSAWVADNTGRATSQIVLNGVAADGNIQFFTSTTNNAGQGTLAATITKTGMLDVVGIARAAIQDKGGQVFNALASGLVGDAIKATGSITSGTTSFTCSTCSFVAGDVSKGIAIGQAGVAGAALYTTIAAVNSGTNLTLANTASATVASKPFVYGTDNTAAMTTWFSAGTGRFLLPKGGYYVKNASVYTLPGNSIIEGVGQGRSVIYAIGAVNGNLFWNAPSNNTSVRHLTIDGVYPINDSTVAGWYAMVRTSGRNNSIQNVEITEFPAIGIEMYGTEVKITDNKITGTASVATQGSYGIFSSSGGLGLSESTISGNTITDCGFNGILLGGGTRTVADGVTNSTTTITSPTAAFVSNDANHMFTVFNGGPNGVNLETTIVSVTNSTTVVLADAVSSSASSVRLRLYLGRDVAIAHNVLRNNHKINSGGGGQIDVGDGFRRVAATGNVITGGQGNTTSGYEWDASDSSITGGVVSDNNRVGIGVGQNANEANISISGVTVKNSGKSGDPHPGIWVGNGASNVTITGNIVTDDRPVKYQTYGIETQASGGEPVSATVRATGNYLGGNLTGDVNDAGGVLVLTNAGQNAPSGACTNGSLFSRTDGSGSSLYACKATAWVAVN